MVHFVDEERPESSPVCARCHAPLPPVLGRGRPRIWCGSACRRSAYDERRAARNGAVAVRVEVREKVVEKRTHEIQYLDRIVEKPAPKPTPAEAVEIVLASPRACRSVLEGLRTQAQKGALRRSECTPILRAASDLLSTLRRERLLT